jgi:hypothetical protein
MFELGASHAFLRRVWSLTLYMSKCWIPRQWTLWRKKHLLPILSAATALNKRAEIPGPGDCGRHGVLLEIWRLLLARCGVDLRLICRGGRGDSVERASALFPNLRRPHWPDLSIDLLWRHGRQLLAAGTNQGGDGDHIDRRCRCLTSSPSLSGSGDLSSKPTCKVCDSCSRRKVGPRRPCILILSTHLHMEEVSPA